MIAGIYYDKPVNIYGFDFIEHKALKQFKECFKPDFVKCGAAMPDMHLGYTMPIGGVVLTDQFTLVPAWVGYDIGCGVSAIRTTFDSWEVKSKSEEIFDNIYKMVPTGKSWNQKAPEGREAHLQGVPMSTWLADKYKERGAGKQLGTLGSGNHFIEIGVGWDEHVWIVVHSGSRNLGHNVASRYIAEACGQATGIYKQKEGSHPLVIGTEPGDDYMKDMNFCLEFALLNRKVILERVEMAIQTVACDGAMVPITLINKNHNSAEPVNMPPYGKGWLHRKGATDASYGVKGVIPGNMRDGTFIVNGRGNADSCLSASHGAGRVGSRREAKEATTLQAFEESMDGIVAKVGLSTLDENHLAYKPINAVMEAQDSLVETINHIKPIINVKA
jgi:tRNA-splicing ligase RtcB